LTITDFHTHAFPDGLARRALAQLTERGGGRQPFLDGTVSGLLSSMDRAGIRRAVLCSIATAPKQFDSILAFSERIRSGRIEPFPSVHPGAPDVIGQVRRIAADGFKGIKLHPLYQRFVTDADEITPLYEAASDEDLIVVFHAGEDFAYKDARVCSPGRIATVAERFGDLTIVAAHMGGYRRWKEARDHLAGRKNVYLETSWTLDEIPRELLDEIVTRHGAGRILFGTDSPWRDQSETIELLKSLRLPPDVERAIFADNAARLLGAHTPPN